MNRNVVAFLLIVGLGSAGLVGYYFARESRQKQADLDASDSGKIAGTVRIGVDSWVGYHPLCGAEMQKRMRSQDWRVKCEDDNADLPGRMAKLASGELDMAVATVDSYLLNGAPRDFPGVIVAVIDESKGGDAIVARGERIRNIEDLKSKSDYKIAFTPASPSEHLVKSVAAHFEVGRLKNREDRSWRVETGGSSEALEKLKQGAVDVAVLWEPDVSRALSDPAFVKILGTGDTRKLIVDVLVAGRRFVADDPGAVGLVLANYFRALKTYRENPKLLQDEVRAKVNLPEDKVLAMLEGVAWMNLYENAANWFGVSDAVSLGYDGLTDTIESTVQILQENGDFSSSPLPDGDPYRIQNRSFIKDLREQGLAANPAPSGPEAVPDQGALDGRFPALSEADWDALKEIGTLKIRPITFQSGTDELDLNGKTELDKAASNLRHYPHFRVVVRGHTSQKGDVEENLKLSLARAEAVERYFEITYNVDPNRVRALGLGGTAPLARLPGESDRAYNYRLPRVELGLVAEVY